MIVETIEHVGRLPSHIIITFLRKYLTANNIGWSSVHTARTNKRVYLICLTSKEDAVIYKIADAKKSITTLLAEAESTELDTSVERLVDSMRSINSIIRELDDQICKNA